MLLILVWLATPACATSSWKPPSYVDEGAFTEEPIVVGPHDSSLPGTLTRPRSEGPRPAVVLVHGSGPSDRDESNHGTKIFRDVAWGLASRGIIVVRYDKRTKARRAEVRRDFEHFTVREEYVNDACAAVEVLTRNHAVDTGSIFVLGHSQGGQMIARIAATCPSVAGLIGMAVPTEQPEDTIVRQARYLGGLPENQNPRAQAYFASMLEAADKLRDPDLATKYRGQSIYGAPPGWWISLKQVDPVAEAKALSQPILLLHGERDYQVPVSDLSPWRDAFGSDARLTVRTYPKLHHLFIEGQGEGLSVPSEYRLPDGHVARYVIDDIVAWIDLHRRSGRPST